MEAEVRRVIQGLSWLRGLPEALVEASKKRDVKAEQHFSLFLNFLEMKEPFTYVRFSDGEMDILCDRSILLNEADFFVRGSWSQGKYADFDVKRYVPRENSWLRDQLFTAATLRAENYWKGIRTQHNGCPPETQFMVDLNGGDNMNLTFADLFLNNFYPDFLRRLLPAIKRQSGVIVIGNYRMNLKNICPVWRLIPVPDGAFGQAEHVVATIQDALSSVEDGSIILSSASSLTNVIGARVIESGRPLTFLDIGTALHPLTDMGAVSRWYHLEAQPWTSRYFMRKLWYRGLPGRSLAW